MMGLRLALVALIAACSLVVCTAAHAVEKTYKCVDEDGYVTFQDEECASDQDSTQLKISQDQNVIESDASESTEEAPAAKPRVAQDSVGGITDAWVSNDSTVNFKNPADEDDGVIEEAEAPGVRLCAHINGVFYATKGRDCKTVAELGSCGLAMQSLRDMLADPKRVESNVFKLRQTVKLACAAAANG